jgi:hypothetical protein
MAGGAAWWFEIPIRHTAYCSWLRSTSWRALQQRPLVIDRDVRPYSADPESFARQMEVFDRMRETERAFKGGRS